MAAHAIFSSFRRPVPQAASMPKEIERPPSPPESLTLDALPSNDPLPTELSAVGQVAGPTRPEFTAIRWRGMISDQLGLLHPAMVFLWVSLEGAQPWLLDAEFTGVYQPINFASAAWIGFAYDIPADACTGIAAGTKLLTQRGELEVEHLMPGDSIMALNHASLTPVLWLGRVYSKSIVRIAPGAFGPDKPRSSLVVGSEQPIFISNTAQLARSFIDGKRVVLVDDHECELFHIDVGRREVLLAEGLPIASGRRASLLG